MKQLRIIAWGWIVTHVGVSFFAEGVTTLNTTLTIGIAFYALIHFIEAHRR